MRKGFTLIELMIVIAIIAIIAAIAIPNLLSGRMSANETSALGAMKQLTSTQAIWLQQGPDGNGIKDYWTYDISLLHRMYRASAQATGGEKTKVAFIPMDFCRADVCPAADAALGADVGYEPRTTVAGNAISPKSGYYFSVMSTVDVSDDPGAPSPIPFYRATRIRGGTTLMTGNHNQYGFMAVPDVYGSSGIRSFIVNEAGTVWACDTGVGGPNETGSGFAAQGIATNPPADQTKPTVLANKWFTSTADYLGWPSANPASAPATAGGRHWEVAE